MAPVVERIKDIPNIDLGEGPYWDIETQSLFFVDIVGKAIHKYVPSTGKHTKAVLDKPVSLIVPVKGHKDKFVISHGKEVLIVTWDGVSSKVSKREKIAEVDQGIESRINDGKCDPTGRLWFGTIGPEPIFGQIERHRASFFSYDNGKVITHLTKVDISNGLAWNTALNKFYYIDSLKKTVDQFDVDLEAGIISNRQPIFTFDKHNIAGVPDGMTIDADGNLWVAVFDGYKVLNIDPRRPETLLRTLDIPAKQTTCVAFGGPNLDILYVTSAKMTQDGVVLPPPDHGATYKVTGLGVKGVPVDEYVL